MKFQLSSNKSPEPWSRLSRTCPNFSSFVVRLFNTDVHDTL